MPGPCQGGDRATPEQSQSLPSWSLWTGRDTVINKITTRMTETSVNCEGQGQAGMGHLRAETCCSYGGQVGFS